MDYSKKQILNIHESYLTQIEEKDNKIQMLNSIMNDDEKRLEENEKELKELAKFLKVATMADSKKKLYKTIQIAISRIDNLELRYQFQFTEEELYNH